MAKDKVNAGEVDTPSLVLSPDVYDKLKLTVQVLLPLLSTLYFVLGSIWGLPEVDKVVGTLAAVAVFLGGIVAVSARRYLKSDARFDGVIVPQVDGGGVRGYSLELNTDPEDIQHMKEVSFKVTPTQVA